MALVKPQFSAIVPPMASIARKDTAPSAVWAMRENDHLRKLRGA